MTDPMSERWQEELAKDLVEELTPTAVKAVAAQASVIAAEVVTAAGTAATGSGGAVAAAGTTTGLSAAVKMAAATIVASLALAAAAVTGNLPDPLQSWVTDLVEQVGIELPRPVELPAEGVLDEIPLPDIPLDELELTIPPITLPEDLDNPLARP